MVRPSHVRPRWNRLLLAAIAGALVSAAAPAAQQKPFMHLNPVIEKLSQGKTVIGAATADLSSWNARSLARAEIDYVYLDMEHNPMRFDAIENFLSSMTDRAAIARKGNVQPNVAVFARFAPFADEHAYWVVKQALDVGLMGILFNTVETKEQALSHVQNMRYAPTKTSAYPEPRGRRGLGTGITSWFWGIPAAEYFERADVWPLNPRGDLLALMMIETVLGVKNADEIAAVPGVGGFYFGVDDLSASIGVRDPEGPEVEESVQAVMKVCRTRKLVCGGTVNVHNAAKRLKDGYRIVNLGNSNGGLTAGTDAVLRAAQAAMK